jgi:hypothetical protein
VYVPTTVKLDTELGVFDAKERLILLVWDDILAVMEGAKSGQQIGKGLWSCKSFAQS